MRALVTGAAGFVGANLCRRLLSDGHEVDALIRPGSDRWRLQELAPHLTISEAGLDDADAVAQALDRVQPGWVFHLAAHGAYSWQTDQNSIFATNAIATAHLIDLACARGVEAFVQAGSSSEYGFKDHAPGETEWIEPNSAYAVSKAAATHYVRAVARATGAHAVTLRLYSAFGPWEEPNRLMPTLALYALRGRLPRLVDPRTARDYVHVDDVCAAFILAARSVNLEPGIVLNVGSGRQTSLGELVEIVREELPITEQPEWGTMDARSWDTASWVADTRRIRTLLGWIPQHGLREGFLMLVDWLRSHPELVSRYEEVIGFNNAST